MLGTGAPLDPRGGANPKMEMQTYFLPFLPENCRKLK